MRSMVLGQIYHDLPTKLGHVWGKCSQHIPAPWSIWGIFYGFCQPMMGKSWASFSERWRSYGRAVGDVLGSWKHMKKTKWFKQPKRFVGSSPPSMGYIPNIWDDIGNYMLVGGLEHQFYFCMYWVANHPNWLIFFRGVAQPPTSRKGIWTSEKGIQPRKLGL